MRWRYVFMYVCNYTHRSTQYNMSYIIKDHNAQACLKFVTSLWSESIRQCYSKYMYTCPHRFTRCNLSIHTHTSNIHTYFQHVLTPHMHIQSSSSDLVSVAEYYSSKLVDFVRSVLEVTTHKIPHVGWLCCISLQQDGCCSLWGPESPRDFPEHLHIHIHSMRAF